MKDDNKIKVVFLCVHNSARSQMAEAFLKKYGGENFIAMSAGLEKTQVNPLVRKVMEEVGMNLEGQYSKTIDDLPVGVDCVDYVITLCEPDRWGCVNLPIGKHLHWHIKDPSGLEGGEKEVLNEVRKIRDEIKNKILAFVNDTLRVK